MITSYKQKQLFKQSKSLLEKFQNLEIKFSERHSKTIHDRYVIVNESEYFHFGHSLKDVVNGKLSRYSKIFNKQEIDNLLPILVQIEKDALLQG